MRRLVSGSLVACSEWLYSAKTHNSIALLALMVTEVSRKIGRKG